MPFGVHPSDRLWFRRLSLASSSVRPPVLFDPRRRTTPGNDNASDPREHARGRSPTGRRHPHNAAIDGVLVRPQGAPTSLIALNLPSVAR